MDKTQIATPASPYESPMFNDVLAKELDSLCLSSKKYSWTETVQDNGGITHNKNSRLIIKNKRNTGKSNKENNISPAIKRKMTMRKTKLLENRIIQLQRQISSLRRMCENCPNCHPESLCRGIMLDDIQLIRQEQLSKVLPSHDHKSSRESVQFEAFDFAQSLSSKPELHDRAWVMIGVMMIAMGSKNFDIDGTINTFKVLNDCVDSVRRQVEKSMQKINLDFYFFKQQMRQNSGAIQGLSFDPFYQKNQNQKAGFQLESLKIQNSQLFQLVYDQKINFSINYQSLIASVQHLKQNCWVSY